MTFPKKVVVLPDRLSETESKTIPTVSKFETKTLTEIIARRGKRVIPLFSVETHASSDVLCRSDHGGSYNQENIPKSK